MENLSELGNQDEHLLFLEIEEIAEILSEMNPSSEEFAILLSSMKNKINQLSDV